MRPHRYDIVHETIRAKKSNVNGKAHSKRMNRTTRGDQKASIQSVPPKKPNPPRTRSISHQNRTNPFPIHEQRPHDGPFPRISRLERAKAKVGTTDGRRSNVETDF